MIIFLGGLLTDKLNISDSTIKSMEIQGDIVVNADIDYRKSRYCYQSAGV